MAVIHRHQYYIKWLVVDLQLQPFVPEALVFTYLIANLAQNKRESDNSYKNRTAGMGGLAANVETSCQLEVLGKPICEYIVIAY